MGTVEACILFAIIQLIYAISAQEVKRAPTGFVGMRGKKSLDLAPNAERFYNRETQFFVGVKGKKDLFESVGFVGMRGKKELSPDFRYSGLIPRLDGSLIGIIDYSANSDFVSDDSSEHFLANVFDDLQHLNRENIMQLLSLSTRKESSNEVDKRAANMRQFYGMRGKKSVETKRPYDLTFRGKFIGVRGKKDTKDNSAQAIKFSLSREGPWRKRKTQMGFFGMRGKKSTDGSSPETKMEVFY